jgi:hypothetical protein
MTSSDKNRLDSLILTRGAPCRDEEGGGSLGSFLDVPLPIGKFTDRQERTRFAHKRMLKGVVVNFLDKCPIGSILYAGKASRPRQGWMTVRTGQFEGCS